LVVALPVTLGAAPPETFFAEVVVLKQYLPPQTGELKPPEMHGGGPVVGLPPRIRAAVSSSSELNPGATPPTWPKPVIYSNAAATISPLFSKPESQRPS
jgi:hypothetical protein